MKLTIAKNEREFDVAAAWRIIGQMLADPRSVIGLLDRGNHQKHARHCERYLHPLPL